MHPDNMAAISPHNNYRSWDAICFMQFNVSHQAVLSYDNLLGLTSGVGIINVDVTRSKILICFLFNQSRYCILRHLLKQSTLMQSFVSPESLFTLQQRRSWRNNPAVHGQDTTTSNYNVLCKAHAASPSWRSI